MTRLYNFMLYFFSAFCGLLLVGSVLTMVGYLLWQGASVMGLKLIFGSAEISEIIDAVFRQHLVIDGLWPAMVGTFSLVFMALSTALPLGLGAGKARQPE